MHAIILPPATLTASTAIVLSPPAPIVKARPLARLARRRIDLLALAAVTAAYRRHNDAVTRAL